MRTTSWNGLWALALSALMLSSLMDRPSELTENGDFEAGRQGGVDADCSGLTFEDIFNYTHAAFDIVFDDDWETAEVRGVAWVNGTLADDVRTDFDDRARSLPIASLRPIHGSDFARVPPTAVEMA